MKTNQNKNSRRDFIRKLSVFSAGALMLPSFFKAGNLPTSTDEEESEADGPFHLPQLPYGYEALEPHIDKTTMDLHHSKHHQTYVTKLNKAVNEAQIKVFSVETLCKNISKYPVNIRNNAGGHYNHSLFWKLMTPKGSGAPTGKLAEAINGTFGSFENFKSKFSETSQSIFGSGWAWLVIGKDAKLEIGTTANQDNPLMDLPGFKGAPVLGLDVWEHAYYLKHQNKRPDYIASWWNVVNWEEAEKNFTGTK
jgi:superoxide dismutase, Fe-Mn family